MTSTVLSVRGEARGTVAPDQAAVYASVSATSETKSDATSRVAMVVHEVVAELVALGGQALVPQTARAALTWSTQSIRTEREHDHDEITGRYGPTGRHRSSANVVITVRDFALLPGVEAIVTKHDAVDVHTVEWTVDADNPAWALVRADAIRAALQKGRDYAAALGGSVVSVDHVADAGLLGSDGPMHGGREMASYALAAGREPDVASLDPVPQVLSALIEARLTANAEPLAAD